MCECVKTINKKLDEKGLNTVIDVPFQLNSDLSTASTQRVSIVTAKKDRSVRKRPTSVFASYCPFCGEKY